MGSKLFTKHLSEKVSWLSIPPKVVRWPSNEQMASKKTTDGIDGGATKTFMQ